MSPKVVIAYPGFGDIEIEKEVLSTINAEIIHTETMDSDETRRALRDADAVMVTIQPVQASDIDLMGKCQIIARIGTGLDAIDMDHAAQKGVWVTYVPDYSIDEVSTQAITLMLVQARGIVPLLAATNEGRWDASMITVRRLASQTLGVAGCGRIGAATAAKGRGLGMRVIGYDPFIPADQLRAAGIEPVDLPTLLQTSDYISLHMPLTPQTRNMIDADALAQMKPSAYLVNTSRGPLIDEDALLAAVRNKTIAGAALDVLVVEPPAPDNPLLHQPGILITPHNAWYSEEAKVDVRRRGAEDVVRVLTGQPPRAPANRVTVTNRSVSSAA